MSTYSRNAEKLGFAARRSTRILAAGAAAAMLLTGASVALALTGAHAATSPSNTVNISADPNAVIPVGQWVRSGLAYEGLKPETQYQMITKLVDAETGADVSRWYGSVYRTNTSTSGEFGVSLQVPTTAAGKKVYAKSYIFDFHPYASGTEAWPTSIKPGFSPLVTSSNERRFQVGTLPMPMVGASTVQPGAPTQQIAYTSPNLTTPPSGNVPAEVVTSQTSGATLATTATDKADGDKQLVSSGTVVDVVKYTGLNPGTVYVLQTQIFNKTDNKLVDFTKALVFSPTARDGEARVEFTLPAGLNGKELVIFQTIYAGADALVGKHLDKVEVRPGATPVVAEINPNSTSQWVVVKDPKQACAVSGYVWKDANKNSLFDANEEPVAGVGVNARALNATGTNFPGNSIVGSSTTDAKGFYRIEVPQENCGNTMVDFNEANYPGGWAPFSGGDSDLQAGSAGQGGWTGAYALKPGTETTRIDAGLRTPSSANIGLTYCGAYDNGYTAKLINATNNQVVQTLTGDQRQFTNVPAGRYWVYFERPHVYYAYYFRMLQGESIAWVQGGSNDLAAGTAEFNYTAGDIVTLQACGKVMWSPLSLDLNGNGKIDTSNIADQPAGSAFDLLGTGQSVASGWLAGGDGFLTKPNADGSVTSLSNLFGGALGEGYAQLADLDKNADGQVSGSELTGLKVWVDANGDHVAQSAELKSLADYGIASLSVNYVNAPVVDNGNVVVEHGSATRADGSHMLLADAYFAVDPGASAANAAAVASMRAATDARLAELPASEQVAITNAFASVR